MPLTDIQNKILADSKEQADRILNEAHAKVSRIESEFDRLVEEKKTEAQTAHEKHLLNVERMMRADIEQQLSQEKEKTKEQLINETFDEAYTSMVKMDKDSYTSLISSFLSSIHETSGSIIIPNDRSEETQHALKQANKQGFDFKETSEIKGGFVFTNDTLRYDYSFETLIKTARDRLMVDVAHKLFT